MANLPNWDPIEIQDKIKENAHKGVEKVVSKIGEEPYNKLKLVGLYHQKQEGYFMLRTKIPGGILTRKQAQTIGEIADKFAKSPKKYGGENQNPIFGDSFLDITTRQDIQMHWIEIEDIPEIWMEYEKANLTTLQACGNSVRNVVSCPISGIDSEETIDVRAIIEKITDQFSGDTKYANLPRKLKVSITGCKENCGRAEINDLGFKPAKKHSQNGFNLYVGGGLSDSPRMASDLNVFIEPDKVVDVVRATADLFIEHGSYEDTAVNRLRFLVEKWGIEKFRNKLQRHLSFKLQPKGETLTQGYRGDHIGVHNQDNNKSYIGLNVPTGRMNGEDIVEITNLIIKHDIEELRLTPNQNLVIPNIIDTEDLLENNIFERYSPNPGPFSRGIVSCTGREFCNYGIIETKNRGFRLADKLDEYIEDEGIDVARMHISGCSASCAQPQIADIGLRGETYRDEEKTKEAVDIGIGGALEKRKFIEWIGSKEPIDSLPIKIKKLISMYENDPEENRTFSEWIDDTPKKEIQKKMIQKQGGT